MNGAHRVPPYFAVARSIEKHPLFNVQRKRRRSWREAWEWMIAEAAWRPRGQRMARGVADLQRGQIAVTARGLAAAWNWSIGNVQYFLKRLREEGMIETRAIHTKIHTGSEVQKVVPCDACNSLQLRQVSISTKIRSEPVHTRSYTRVAVGFTAAPWNETQIGSPTT